ncbi:unnamed protein product [Adineta steineri]|uniref:Uncharacterized protein n=1 Tax=Adineta steineri TaxID=433720 RepID=A0A815Q5D3_9BILA|nr:unnamed protein product [Adineta steineri]CAF1424372.1 unnamed protein product [Adineta steineri]CAF1458298.1 unnamed protein product [Adineta steineri]
MKSSCIEWNCDGGPHIIYLIRTSYRGANSYHNSNRITYKKLLNYQQLLPPVIIDKNTKWKQSATTVAGGHGAGSELNQLNRPQGFYVDDNDDSIYIADTDNHRIVRWKFGANNGEIVAGGNVSGNELYRLKTPEDVILDKEKTYLIICDMGNS